MSVVVLKQVRVDPLWVVVGLVCLMNRLMSNASIPAATHKLASVCQNEWNLKPGDSAAVGKP